jgi:hypothetical protein
MRAGFVVASDCVRARIVMAGECGGRGGGAATGGRPGQAFGRGVAPGRAALAEAPVQPQPPEQEGDSRGAGWNKKGITTRLVRGTR